MLEDGFSDPGVQLASDSLSWVEGASGPELDIKTLGKKKKKRCTVPRAQAPTQSGRTCIFENREATCSLLWADPEPK